MDRWTDRQTDDMVWSKGLQQIQFLNEMIWHGYGYGYIIDSWIIPPKWFNNETLYGIRGTVSQADPLLPFAN